MASDDGKVRVMVVDDSALMRKMIPMILNSDPDIEVVATAMDGDFALKKIPEISPDVITLDIDMPRLDGLSALQCIVRDFKIPVVLVSSLAREGAETTLRGLEMGAFDFVPKPYEAISVHINEVSAELISKVKAAARSRTRKSRPMPLPRPKPSSAPLKAMQRPEGVVAVGISTGGPQALAEILPLVPPDYPLGILIVQHMPEGFTEIFAKRLDSVCGITVREASDGETICPGKALIAPGGRHLKVINSSRGAMAMLSLSPPVSGHRPSATVLFKSVAEQFGERAIGLIMTGMGDDGVEGLSAIRDKGGVTLAQDEESSVIYGMPKLAAERGYADKVVGLYDIVPELIRLASGHQAVMGAPAREDIWRDS